MVLGDLSAWRAQCLSIDERFLERVSEVWPKCIALCAANSPEDHITINLVSLLGKDPVIRRICHYVEYQFEPFGTAPDGSKFSKGKIDLAVLLDWERERYMAYECKRLNVIHNGHRNSLATLYVTNGIMRFITEQYAESLPVGFMLGYVIDGDTVFAMSQLAHAIDAHTPVRLTTGPIAMASGKLMPRFSTTHERATGEVIELRHALLPFSQSA